LKRPSHESHQKFFALRKDTDPGIAGVEDARKRLSELKDILELNVFIEP
jgi:uncharacterized protein with GYD domain